MFPQQTKFQAFSLSNVIHQPTHVNTYSLWKIFCNITDNELPGTF